MATLEGIEHGKLNSYVRHRCRCTECKAVASDYYRARYAAGKRVKHKPEDATEHGMASTYKNYACRCAECSLAYSEYRRLSYLRSLQKAPTT